MVELLHQPDDNMLSVNVISGSNMVAKDSNGKSDPYCIVKFRDKHYKTEVNKVGVCVACNHYHCIDLYFIHTFLRLENTQSIMEQFICIAIGR